MYSFAQTMLMIAGIVACLLVLGIILLFTWGKFLDARRKYHLQMTTKAEETAIARLGDSLVRDSYWFSESREAFEAVRKIGLTLHERRSYDIAKIRDEWREAIKKASSAPIADATGKTSATNAVFEIDKKS